MNWLDPPVEPPNVPEPQDPEAPSESNLNYWAARLLPLHDPTPTYSSPKPDADVEVNGNGREVVFVGCNRVGTEEGTSQRLVDFIPNDRVLGSWADGFRFNVHRYELCHDHL